MADYSRHMKAEQAKPGVFVRGIVSRQLYKIRSVYDAGFADGIALIYVDPINPKHPEMFPKDYCISTMEVELVQLVPSFEWTRA